jgi:hypothetical protein
MSRIDPLSQRRRLPHFRLGKLYFGNTVGDGGAVLPTGGRALFTGGGEPLPAWLADKAVKQASKRAKKLLPTPLARFAYWASDMMEGRKPRPDAISREVTEARKAFKTGVGRGAATVKVLHHLYISPAETALAAALADPELSESVEDEAIHEWGWRNGMKWVSGAIVKLALASLPSMLFYYNAFGELPGVDKAAVAEVRDVISSVEGRIVRKFEERGIPVDEASAFDLATKLVVLAYLHPTESANAILDYATENIVTDTIRLMQQNQPRPAGKDVRDVKMPGSWQGGRRARRWKPRELRVVTMSPGQGTIIDHIR